MKITETKILLRIVLMILTVKLDALGASRRDVNELIAKGTHLQESGSQEESRATFKEARVLAQTIPNEGTSGFTDALLDVVSAQAKAGFYEDAQITVESFLDSYNQAMAISYIAHFQFENGKTAAARVTIQKAIRAAKSISVLWPQALVLQQIAHFQIQAGQYLDAQATANLISDPGLKQTTLREAAKARRERSGS